MNRGSIPYDVRTPRLHLRCWQPADAPHLKAAIDESLEGLARYVPWGKDEPTPLPGVVQRLRGFRADFDRDENWIYAILDRSDGTVLGGTGLHPRVGPEAIEIGYWVRASRQGAGIAREAAHALTRVALESVGWAWVQIHCEPVNLASRRIPERLGYDLAPELQPCGTEPDRSCRLAEVWTMTADAWRAQPHRADVSVALSDAAGAPMALTPPTP